MIATQIVWVGFIWLTFSGGSSCNKVCGLLLIHLHWTGAMAQMVARNVSTCTPMKPKVASRALVIEHLLVGWCWFELFVALSRELRAILPHPSVRPPVRLVHTEHVLWCKWGPAASTLQHHFLIEPFDLWLIPLISNTIFPTECFPPRECVCVSVCVSRPFCLTTHQAHCRLAFKRASRKIKKEKKNTEKSSAE